MNVAIPHNIPYFSESQNNICADVISGTSLVRGVQIQKFEDALCEYLGLTEGHVVLVSSGSAALYLSLWALGLQEKLIALPVYSCSALLRSVKLLNANPFFVDCCADSFAMDSKHIDGSVDGVIFPHMYGYPSKIDVPDNVKLIEDCAQSLGANINGQRIGLQGDIGIYSFYATKIITSGGHGGACFSRDKSVIDSIRDYINFDFKSADVPGFNFQMTELQAAFGLAQFRNLDEIVRKRNKLFEIYKSFGLSLYNSQFDSNHINPVRYRAVLETSEPDYLISELKKRNISSIVPLEDWELLIQDFKTYHNAHRFTKNSVSLPIYSALTEDQANFIAMMTQQIVSII